ncbi:hypothetical protein I0C86_24585 [Plantactinospora sp. S1510]|uniref:DUF4145 domain-containing protein n=1 Tax=Plantactinospora alkalitolerans TaxID=2789879 RepID=A0ABS0H0X3_9ACTN|nr:hypothetical protein [Plantactinospora alkalitolerans]MBF9132110.1 hypothetical protein [Plantactinospora alkalitolerans]
MLEGVDDNTLEEIARIACGGEDLPVYRRGTELPKLLQQAGWDNVPRYNGEHRRDWLTQHLRARRAVPGAIDAVVCRLVDRREYIHRNEPLAVAEVTQIINVLLAAEGYEVIHAQGRPTVRPYKPASDHEQAAPETALHVSITDLISDPELASVLEDRLNEARICDRNGAYTSAIIMLGSLLEGVLLDAVKTRMPDGTRSPDKLYLSDLIEAAHQNKWIQADVRRFASVLREYRNLVHPNAQVRLGHAPDRDTLSMCWPVINAALNDLAATAI